MFLDDQRPLSGECVAEYGVMDRLGFTPDDRKMETGLAQVLHIQLSLFLRYWWISAR